MAEVVIAARGGDRAKQRLAGVLDGAARAALTRAMLADMLDAVQAAPGVTRVWVVTPTAELARLAAEVGAGVVLEARGQGLTAAYGLARRAIARARPEAVVAFLPGDLPLLESGDIAALLAEHRPGGAVLVPAKADGGTGALVLAAGAPFAFACGPDSLGRHASAAADAGLTPRLAALDNLAFDLDRPADLATLGASGRGGPHLRALLGALTLEAAR